VTTPRPIEKRRPGEFQHLLEGLRAKLAHVSPFQSRQAALGLPAFTRHRPAAPKSRTRRASRFRDKIQQLFPKWAHRRDRNRWERRWFNPEFNPFWKTDEPQKEIVDAVESGWFPKNQTVIDLGCGSGEICRWLGGQGFAVLGLDYSAAAIARARRLSPAYPNALTFEIADLCREDLQLEPAFSLIDRGCFHRIVKSLRPVFAQNIAQTTVEGGHFLLIVGTFQDTRVVNHRAISSEQRLREHVKEIFGNHFIFERAEATFLNAREGHESMPALAFWMVRRSKSATSD
jgi:SAM-dependent methyltransferase